MEFQYDFEASDSAGSVRHIRSDELEGMAESRIPIFQIRECDWKRWNARASCDWNTRIAQVPEQLLGPPELDSGYELSM
jgi:hypothetical protein